jgi:hypothetical protein
MDFGEFADFAPAERAVVVQQQRQKAVRSVISARSGAVWGH